MSYQYPPQENKPPAYNVPGEANNYQGYQQQYQAPQQNYPQQQYPPQQPYYPQQQYPQQQYQQQQYQQPPQQQRQDGIGGEGLCLGCLAAMCFCCTLDMLF